MFCASCGAHVARSAFSKSQLKSVKRGQPGKCKACTTSASSSSSAAKCGPVAPSGAPATAEEGYALTMHQPWASLLVAGIKRVEGRSWGVVPSGGGGGGGGGDGGFTHGALWIHAAAKEPDPGVVEEVEMQYRALYGELDGLREENGDLAFPQAYPTSALLGCVDVAAVLSAEAFQQIQGLSASERLESESEFVFLCQSPRRLLLPRREAGQHKIWRLQGAKKAATGLVPAAAPPRLPAPTNFRKLLRS